MKATSKFFITGFASFLLIQATSSNAYGINWGLGRGAAERAAVTAAGALPVPPRDLIVSIAPAKGANARLKLPSFLETKDANGKPLVNVENLDARVLKNGVDMIYSRKEPLKELLRGLRNSSKPVILLEGEQGVGKTTLVEAAAARIHAGSSEALGLSEKRIIYLDHQKFVTDDGVPTAEFNALLTLLKDNKEEAKNIIIHMNALEMWVRGGVDKPQQDKNITTLINRILTMQNTGATLIINVSDVQSKMLKASLVNRFSVVKLLPTTIEETVEILKLRALHDYQTYGGLSETVLTFASKVAQTENLTLSLPESAIELLKAARLNLDLDIITEPKSFVTSLEDNVAKLTSEIRQLDDTYSSLLVRDQLQSEILVTQARIKKAQAELLKYKVQFEEVEKTLERIGPLEAGLKNLKGEERSAQQATIELLKTRVNRQMKVLKWRAPHAIPSLQDDTNFVLNGIEGFPALSESKKSVVRRRHLGERSYENLAEEVGKKVIGHTPYVKSMMDDMAIYADQTGEEPYFVMTQGRSQVGKTYAAIVAAEKLGYEVVLLKGSDYGYAHAVTKITGAGPTFVGYGDVTELKAAIVRNDGKVMLIADEWDKFHQDVKDVFLGLSDPSKSKLDDATGSVSMKNVIIVATSNVGSHVDDDYAKYLISLNNPNWTEEKIRKLYYDMERPDVDADDISTRLREYYTALKNPKTGEALERPEALLRMRRFAYFGGFKNREINQLLAQMLIVKSGKFLKNSKIKVEISRYAQEYLAAHIANLPVASISKTQVESVIDSILKNVYDLIDNKQLQKGDAVYLGLQSLETAEGVKRTLAANVRTSILLGGATKPGDLSTKLSFKAISTKKTKGGSQLVVTAKAYKNLGASAPKATRFKPLGERELYAASKRFANPVTRDRITEKMIYFAQ